MSVQTRPNDSSIPSGAVMKKAYEDKLVNVECNFSCMYGTRDGCNASCVNTLALKCIMKQSCVSEYISIPLFLTFICKQMLHFYF